MSDKFTIGNCLIELHLHLDGSLSIKNARELAKLEGVTLPDSDAELKNRLTVSPGCKDLNEYLTKFDLPCSLLQSAPAIELAMFNLCNELADNGVIYGEIKFAPQQHLQKGLTQEDAIQAAIRGMQKSKLKGSIIVACMRSGQDNHAANFETVRLAKKYLGKGVCATDLAGAEAAFPNEGYAEEFKLARELGVPFTMHSGEALGAQSVAVALDYGASRIGHGVRSLEDPAVIKRLVDNKITLEVCPKSNIDTCIFKDFAEVPLLKFRELGVLVALSSDDDAVSDTNIRLEYENMARALNLTNADIKGFMLNGANAVFADEATKAELRKLIEERQPA
ncbi:MAG: adenosine deaminase [Synergistaceae bacterium]|nr:adenosine deaminase [Synergistaceae bacterium]